MEFLLQIVGRCFGLLVLLILFSGCASSPSHPNAGQSAVRKVVFNETPELRDWAERARKLGDEIYPKILALLADGTAKPPRQIDIVFRKQLKGDAMGLAIGRTVYLNASYFVRETNKESSYLKDSVNFDKVLVHEITHVVQQRSFSSDWKQSNEYWAEGLADYVRYKLGYKNGWSCPQCGFEYPHYTSGYWCAGAFLLYVDSTYGSNVVRRLNSELRRGLYSDSFFAGATGKSLDELWACFQKTAAYMPGADDTHRYRQALGYVDGRPPKDFAARAVAYIKKKPGGALTLDAGQFLATLIVQNKLPGVTKAVRMGKSFSLALDPVDLLNGSESADFPATRKWFGQYNDESEKNYYIVFRASQERPWKLQRAWRATRDGHLIQNFEIE